MFFVGSSRFRWWAKRRRPIRSSSGSSSTIFHLCGNIFFAEHGIRFPDHEMLPNGQLIKEHQQSVMEVSSSPAKSSVSFTTECCPLFPKRFKECHDYLATTSISSGSVSTCYVCNQQFGDVVALKIHQIKSYASHLMETPPTTAPPAQQTPEQTGSSNAQGCVSSTSSQKTSPAPFQ